MLECTPADAPRKTRTERLAAAILADRARTDTPSRANAVECFTCGHGMIYHGQRFCSDRCRDYFDAGNHGHVQDWRQPKPSRTASLSIRCAHCGKEFDSRGLRCCSAQCERSYAESQANLAVMAEVGVRPAAKRQCACCGARIPTWRNGRRVSKNTRFCSPKCSRKPKTLGTTEIDIETSKIAA
jgi:hypothetical protein